MDHKQDRDGRMFIAAHDVRGAIVTANASLSTSDAANTILIAGDTDYFLDIIEMTFANSSTVGISVDLLNDGTVVRHVDIPATNTVQLMFDAPLKQVTKSTPWIVDMNGTDITGSSVTVGAALIKKPA